MKTKKLCCLEFQCVYSHHLPQIDKHMTKRENSSTQKRQFQVSLSGLMILKDRLVVHVQPLSPSRVGDDQLIRPGMLALIPENDHFIRFNFLFNADSLFLLD